MIRKRLTAMCDCCGKIREFHDITRDEVERDLVKLRWRKVAADTHYCPGCVLEMDGTIVGKFKTEPFGQVIVRDRQSRQ